MVFPAALQRAESSASWQAHKPLGDSPLGLALAQPRSVTQPSSSGAERAMKCPF
jgi:hypothetical protein